MDTTMPEQAPQQPSRAMRRIAAASVMGTSIEIYDFFIYGTAAGVVFNKLFFPAADPLVGTLLAFSTFAVGFVARPIGGAVFGHFGDRIGRKRMLIVSLLLMGLATAAIGILPTYAQIGVFAPLALVSLRFLQGFAVGGEWGGAVLLVVEHAPPQRRGFYGSLPQMGSPIGLFLSTSIFFAVSSLPGDAFETWGWRIPFLFSLVLVAIGLYVRLRIEETPEFTQLRAEGKRARLPILDTVRRYPRQLLLCAASFVSVGTTNYIVITFSLSYGTGHLDLNKSDLLAVQLVCAAAILVIIPVAGAATDRYGRRAVFLTAIAAMALAAYPLFALFDTRIFLAILLGTLLPSIGIGIASGAFPSFYAEQFDTEVRYTGASVGYQLGAVVSGLSPLIATALVGASGGYTTVVLYMVATGVVSFVAVLLSSETNRTGDPDPSKGTAVGNGHDGPGTQEPDPRNGPLAISTEPA